jgi:hypothetical protein
MKRIIKVFHIPFAKMFSGLTAGLKQNVKVVVAGMIVMGEEND